MSGQPIFSKDELRVFRAEVWSKFRGGIRSSEGGVLYTVVMLIGVGWASAAIPSINNSEISPETLGIYVIGFLITVTLDSLVLRLRHKDSSRIEVAILDTTFIIGIVLTVVASWLSTKGLNTADPPQAEWRPFASLALVVILAITIVMSLILTGIDSKRPAIGSVDKPVSDIDDRRD